MGSLRKRGVIVPAVQGMILMLVLIVVILMFYSQLIPVLFGFAEKQRCQSSFLAMASTKLMGKSISDPDCKTRRLTLTIGEEETEATGGKYDLLRSYPGPNGETGDVYPRIVAMNRLIREQYAATGALETNLYDYFEQEGADESPTAPSSEAKNRVKMRYNMDRAIGLEMQDCWDKVGQGKLDLFDNWFGFFQCTHDDEIGTCTDPLDYFRNGVETRDVARFCVLCSRIKFSAQVQEAFSGEKYQPISSINAWLRNHPVRAGDTRSVYEYLLDPRQRSIFTEPDYLYTTERPLAVLFLRANMHQFLVGLSEISYFLRENVGHLADSAGLLTYQGGDEAEKKVYSANLLQLVEYDRLPEVCDYVVGSFE